MKKPEPLTPEWRKWHVDMADSILAMVRDQLDHTSTQQAMVFIAMAQAHYQAANVRARPLPSDD